jgi:hypothetical protein
MSGFREAFPDLKFCGAADLIAASPRAIMWSVAGMEAVSTPRLPLLTSRSDPLLAVTEEMSI